jgi:hypothetical protein
MYTITFAAPSDYLVGDSSMLCLALHSSAPLRMLCIHVPEARVCDYIYILYSEELLERCWICYSVLCFSESLCKCLLHCLFEDVKSLLYLIG